MGAANTEVIDYFHLRIRGLIRYKHLIRDIKIFIERVEYYGYDSFRIHFNVILNEENFDLMPVDDLVQIDKYFVDKYVSFLIKEGGYKSYRDHLKRLKEFYDLYNTLTTFLIKFLDATFSDTISIQIESPDNFPELNYVHRFWNDNDFSPSAYEQLYKTDLNVDSYQFLSLHKLAQDSKEFIKTLSKSCWLTDKQIHRYFKGSRADVRSFVIQHQVPIKIKGYRTINKVLIEGNTLKSIIGKLPELVESNI
ncbi:hypothetical protein HUW51_07140 [Adhaeribacter swui]|uniref:Uncharacterized protein n=1 Tax=Adhaeribacter swui TaxID=2086471 RepID=A0A7G7G5S6_9BACT|nr:hypothetical protein [Adhaeribacter swui]QNF32510.1 hypothetical protein HUW51_07140 [Adhaeribacter swui]